MSPSAATRCVIAGGFTAVERPGGFMAVMGRLPAVLYNVVAPLLVSLLGFNGPD